MSILPPDLVDLLNQTYLLRILATDPAKVLPPGKSLLSMMTSRTISEQPKAITQPKEVLTNLNDVKAQVELMMHKAFWDEAQEKLSSPFPATQLVRLQLLYADLHTSISPLIPPNHPVILKLTAPSHLTTNNSLHSALPDLCDILRALRERCAPIRDEQLDVAINKLESRTISDNDAATVVISAVRDIIEISDVMKEDLGQFVVGQMSETQLRAVLTEQARRQERAVILKIWGADVNLSVIWDGWMKESPPGLLDGYAKELDGGNQERLIRRLVHALGMTVPVSCPIPTQVTDERAHNTRNIPQVPDNNSENDTRPTLIPHSIPASNAPICLPDLALQTTSDLSPEHTNQLPPQFLFSIPALLHIQNLIQALVIAAALRSLVPPSDINHRLPADSTATQSHTSYGNHKPLNLEDPNADFVERIWALLLAEIDRDEGTRLVNLADEVVRAYRHSQHPSISKQHTVHNDSSRDDSAASNATSNQADQEQEERLRATVSRILRTTDPVFVLLQKRLLHAIVERLQTGLASSTNSSALPAVMRTGTDTTARDGGQHGLPKSASASPDRRIMLQKAVKGFEDPVLKNGVIEVVERINEIVEWVESTWSV